MLTEKIYGDMATVFHRTSVADLIDRVYTSGFKPGEGAMYGKGFYATYELGSQENPEMAEIYGNIVVKFSVNVSTFVIFDYDEFEKTSSFKRYLREGSEKNFVVWQLEDFGIDLKGHWDQDIEAFYQKEPKLTSDIALFCYKRIPGFYTSCNGIIFTGSRDGQVLVCYEPNLVIPLSYKLDGKNNFEKVPTNLSYLSQVVDTKFSIERVQRDFILNNKSLEFLPINLPEKIKGDLICHNNKLMSLDGAPKEVGGTFDCANNELIDLEGGPERVGGDYYCGSNPLDNLVGAPKEVKGDFDFQNSGVRSLVGSPKKIGGSFFCRDNKLRDLYDGPKEVGGNYVAINCGADWTEKQIREICKVRGKVII